MSEEKGVPVMRDEWGAGTNCSKCGKICYFVLYANKKCSDAWTTSTLAQFDHKDCDDALIVTGEQQKVIDFWNEKDKQDEEERSKSAEEKFEESVKL